MDDNYSWNCGHEGEEGVPSAGCAGSRLRIFVVCSCSNGIPMLRAGDEFLNTQFGNNNPYNQDNEIGWLDWSQLAKRHSLSRLSELFLEALRRPSFDSTNSTVGLTACRQHARQVALACEQILPNLSLTSSGAAISGMALAGHANAIASGAVLTKG